MHIVVNMELNKKNFILLPIPTHYVLLLNIQIILFGKTRTQLIHYLFYFVDSMD